MRWPKKSPSHRGAPFSPSTESFSRTLWAAIQKQVLLLELARAYLLKTAAEFEPLALLSSSLDREERLSARSSICGTRSHGELESFRALGLRVFGF